MERATLNCRWYQHVCVALAAGEAIHTAIDLVEIRGNALMEIHLSSFRLERAVQHLFPHGCGDGREKTENFAPPGISTYGNQPIKLHYNT